MTQAINHESEEWLRARERVTARREFGTHVFVYIVVNAGFIGIWALTGAGYFWPAWVLGCWAIGLVLHGWDAFVKRPVTEADVDAELHRDRAA
ncbi:MAG TPA: 2TM domain-containing protein [Acidimicrobiales bacterium]